MSARHAIVTLTCLTAAGLIAVGVAELPGSSSTSSTAARLTPARTSILLAGSPPPLAALHEQGGALLEGGARALRARLRALKGYPVVINKWASWCVPCKDEFGALQRVASLRAPVAFSESTPKAAPRRPAALRSTGELPGYTTRGRGGGATFVTR
jgi:thiol-disulfide isomerase/thioredoxin